MGFLTLGDFQTDLQSALGDRNIPAPRLARWINHAYLDVSSAVAFEALEATELSVVIGGVRSTPIPEDTLMIKMVRDTSSDRLLGWLPKIEFMRRTAASSGAPLNWTRHGEEILLHPTPNTIYDLMILYQRTPDRLAVAGDQTVLPDLWDIAIHQLSVYHGHLSLGEEQRGSVWYARAVNFIQTRLSEDLLQATSGGLGLSIPPIRLLDIRPFIGQLGAGQQGGQ